jgi:hypothetical protein
MARGREMIEPHEGDKRYVRRDAEGKFKEVVDMGRSLSQDRKRSARHTATRGEGDKGDGNSRSRSRSSSSTSRGGSSGSRGSRGGGR